MGTDSVYTLTSSYERDAACPVCSPGVVLEVDPGATLGQVLETMVADERLGKHISAPSVSYGTANLYMRGVLEEQTRPNLDKVRAAVFEAQAFQYYHSIYQVSLETIYLIHPNPPPSELINKWINCAAHRLSGGG